jgi:hypothetical protein
LESNKTQDKYLREHTVYNSGWNRCLEFDFKTRNAQGGGFFSQWHPAGYPLDTWWI